ncbi:MAG: cation:proton antiporter, partial [Saprospiraceae bacterium]|nr:cation:proton antiporter [Saprospiraceae bacterium]
MVEIGSIVILGILAQWMAWRLKVPAILPLIITGLIVGPLSTLWTGGQKLIEPIWNASSNTGLFPGETLFHFVELGIGIILFEGGMTLKRDEIKGVGDTIIRLITGGALITFIGGALVAHFLIGRIWDIAFLFAGLIIVTGPTVIAPILRNVPLNKNVSTVLKWEGILIDPIGALVAVLVYEFIISADGGLHFTSEAIQHFLVLVCVGLALGVGSAYLMRFLLKRNSIPHYLLTIFSLAYVLAVFVGSNLITPDSGLLTVVVCGM